MYRSSPFRSTLNTSCITALDMCEVCTEAVHSVALSQHELHHSFGHVWSMYRSSPFRSTLNTNVITGLGMCEVCTEAIHSLALWTRVTSQVWACVKYMYRSSPFRSTFNTFRSTLNTGYITGLGMCEVCTEAVHSVALWTRVTSQVWACVKYVPKQSVTWHFEHELRHRFGHVWSMYRSSPFRSTLDRSSPFRSTLNMCYITCGHVWSMYRSSPFRSTLNTSYITALDICEVCTEAVHSVALWTRVTSQLWACVKYVPKQSIPYHFEHELHHRFGHVWSMYRSSPVSSTLDGSSPFRSTLNMCYITALGMWSMYRSSPFRSTLNTSYITALDMCEVCTEAVHSVALSQHELHHSFGHVWSMYRSSPFRSTLNTSYITALGMCEVCTEAVHSVALWTRVTSQVWQCVKYVPKQSLP